MSTLELRTYQLGPADAERWAAAVGYSEPQPQAYRIYRLAGPLDVGALERALTDAMRRQESLRTLFSHWSGSPTAAVLPPGDVRLAPVDVDGTGEAQEAEALRQAHAAGSATYDLSAAPAWRAHLLRLGPDSHLLVLGAHELICDDAGFEILARELLAHYASHVGGAAPPPELARQCADLAAAEREWADSAGEEAAAWWQEALAGAPLAIELRERPAGETAPFDVRTAEVPVERQRALTELAAGGRDAHLTAWMTALARWSGTADVVVGCLVEGRSTPEARALVGGLARWLPIRLRLGGERSLRDALHDVAAFAAQALRHAPLAPSHEQRLLQAGVPRGLWSRQVRFAYAEDGPAEPLEAAGLRAELVARTVSLDLLALDVAAAPDGGAVATVRFDPRELRGEDVDRLLVEYERVLGALVDALDAPALDAPVGAGGAPVHRGFRLARRLREVEQSLREHPEIGDAAVAWDDESSTIEARLILPRSRAPWPRELDTWLQEHVPAWVLPTRYVEVDDLGTPTWRRPLAGLPPPPSQAEAEMKLRALWRAGLEVDQVRVDDSFFVLGGTLATGLAMLARSRAEGIEIAPGQLLATPTIAELCAAAEESSAAAAPDSPAPAVTDPFQVRVDGGRILGASLPRFRG